MTALPILLWQMLQALSKDAMTHLHSTGLELLKGPTTMNAVPMDLYRLSQALDEPYHKML